MSHEATTWAIQQKGLKPAPKIVLWHLADCHNPVSGCFPSAGYLARTCGMSISSVRKHVAALEGMGLIKRVRMVDPDTRRSRPTRYYFNFEKAGAATSAPDAS